MPGSLLSLLTSAQQHLNSSCHPTPHLFSAHCNNSLSGLAAILKWKKEDCVRELNTNVNKENNKKEGNTIG